MAEDGKMVDGSCDAVVEKVGDAVVEEVGGAVVEEVGGAMVDVVGGAVANKVGVEVAEEVRGAVADKVGAFWKERAGMVKEPSKEELMETSGRGLFSRILRILSIFFSKEENLSLTFPRILPSIPSNFSILLCSCFSTSKSLVFLVSTGSVFALSSFAFK